MPTTTFDNGAGVAVQVNTAVTDGTTRDGILMYENSGQASGRQAISWYNGGTAYYKARLWTQVGSGYNETTFGIDVADNARNLDTRLIIQNGNVGIGTITPTTRLQVNGDASIMSANNSSAGRSSYMRFANTADSTTAYFGLDGGGLVGNENGATLVGSSTGKSILFAPALTERMRITSGGNVGIGTNNPFSTARLQVNTGTNKNLAIQTGTTDSTGVKLNSFNDAGNANIPMELNSSLLILKTGETEKTRITNDGYVLIGNTTDSRFLSVHNLTDTSTGVARLYAASAAFTGTVVDIGSESESAQYNLLNIRYGSGQPNVALRVVGNGRVGIGTTNPSANLQVLKEIYTIGGTNPRVVIGDSTATGNWGATKWDTATGTFHFIHSTYNTDVGALIVNSSGNVGIKTSTTGTYALNINGTFYSAGSSKEYKTEITKLDIDTDKLMELRPVTYQYKDEYKHLGKELKSGTQIGLIAEEVAEVFPELAILKQDEDGEIRVRNVDYEKLSILLLSQVQKLKREVEELKTK